ncbi:E3 ubiquitin-protein ligase XIAP [Lamellibrachia satsuma]|nr:E3 ubiquitin-protein ligase XIAP [Lamellibrachia satsuma]
MESVRVVFIGPKVEMENHLNRLATFKNLPESSSVSACVVSKAGFYYTGEGDTVACYSCGLSLSHCKPDTQPVNVHRQVSSECQFLVTQQSRSGEIDRESVQPVSTSGSEVSEAASLGSATSQVSPHRSRQERRRNRRSSFHQYNTRASTGASPRPSPSQPNGSVDRSPCKKLMRRIDNNDPTLLEEMKYERSRLSSYTNWPRDTNIEPEALAQAGLFYLCRDDRVKCAFCHCILRNWKPSDEPMMKHRHTFLSCPFLLNPRTAGNVVLGEEPTEEQILHVHSPDSQCVVVEVKHPVMTLKGDRRASFDTWPRTNHVSPDCLAHAGFYYTGVHDEVCCFSCNGRLSRWQANDDPMTWHRRSFPDCDFAKVTGADNEPTSP